MEEGLSEFSLPSTVKTLARAPESQLESHARAKQLGFLGLPLVRICDHQQVPRPGGGRTCVGAVRLRYCDRPLAGGDGMD
jgi:hypothetical protein